MHRAQVKLNKQTIISEQMAMNLPESWQEEEICL